MKLKISTELILGGILALMIFAGGFLIVFGERLNFTNKNLPPTDKKIKVEIQGAVKNPGIYELEESTRVEDALNLAGLLNEADLSKMEVSLALPLLDGQKIYVPFKGEKNKNENKININTASAEELEKLPGIGPVLAQRIINYRKNKPFTAIEEIKNVKGIGEKRFADIEDLICVE